jgi:exopolysaccharide biosynthesis protein
MSYQAVIKALNSGGNSRLERGVMVISAGPKLASRLSKLKVGSRIAFSTATRPDLAGAKTGLGGGPTLVHDGKPWHWSNPLPFRHPRSAFGWNRDFFFLMQVDGRQVASAGMTFEELADYLVRLGCEEAINLDGGGSATLWVEGKVVNRPSQGRERPSCNTIMLIKRPSALSVRPATNS